MARARLISKSAVSEFERSQTRSMAPAIPAPSSRLGEALEQFIEHALAASRFVHRGHEGNERGGGRPILGRLRQCG